MIRRAPRWYTGSDKSWERFNSIWPWAAGFALGGLYYYNKTPFDDVMSSAFSVVRKPLLNMFAKMEELEDDRVLAALEFPPDMLFGPLPLKQQMFFAKQALEEENELGDGYITRMIIDRIDFGLGRVFADNEFYKSGGEELYDEAVRRYRTNADQRVKFFNCDRFIRLMNIALESKEIAQKHLAARDGVELILQAIKETSDPYTPHLGTRALTLLAIHQAKDGSVEKRITATPDGIHTLCDVYEGASGDPHETRFVTLLLSSILRIAPKSSKKFIESNGIGTIFAGMNKTQYKAMPQHLRLYQDITAKDVQAVRKHLHESDMPISIVLGVAKIFWDFFGIQEQMYAIVKQCIDERGAFDFVSYGGMDIMQRGITKWPMGSPESERLHEQWQYISRRVLNDAECLKYAKESPEMRDAFARAAEYLGEKDGIRHDEVAV